MRGRLFKHPPRAWQTVLSSRFEKGPASNWAIRHPACSARVGPSHPSTFRRFAVCADWVHWNNCSTDFLPLGNKYRINQTRSRSMRLIRLVCLAIVAMTTSAAVAQLDTTFTYQGELLDNGLPADGLYAFYVRPWDSEYGGTAVHIGNLVFPEVVDGKFSIESRFWSRGFRWLGPLVGTRRQRRKPLAAPASFSPSLCNPNPRDGCWR